MDEADAGIDRQEILSQIAGAIPMEQETLPPPLLDPAPPMPPATAAVETMPAPRPPSSRALQRPSRWRRHRHEIAGLVTAVVSVVWVSVGFASRTWAPALVGAGFGLGAFAIGAFAVWTGD
ncbi:MAG TPA: hypothetical protein VE981_07475 [Planctomycetota bacterium]|nr:hypothetical protein [Planctomycetota bacterium]